MRRGSAISRAWVGLVVLAAGAGCQLLTGIDQLTVQDASDAGPEIDTGTQPEAGSMTEGGKDADATPPQDSSAPTDTGTSLETGPPPDGATGDWCALQPTGYRLCSDFDLPAQSVTDGFDHGLVPNGVGGSFSLDTNIFLSSPRSALGKANPFPAMGTSGILLIGTLWALGPTPSTLSCTIAWNPRNLSTTTNDYAHVIEFGQYSDAQETMEPFTLSINMNGDGTLILLEYYRYDLSKNATHAIPYSVATGGWIPVRMALAVGISATTYTVSVGGVQADGSTLSVPLPAMSHGTFEVGPAFFGGNTTAASPGWTFDYDNVVCY
jgi:hypothetical protein